MTKCNRCLVCEKLVCLYEHLADTTNASTARQPLFYVEVSAQKYARILNYIEGIVMGVYMFLILDIVPHIYFWEHDHPMQCNWS